MTIGEILKTLEKLPPDEEIFVRQLDSDGDPMFLIVNGVTIDPEGIMIQGGEEIVFTDPEKSTLG